MGIALPMFTVVIPHFNHATTLATALAPQAGVAEWIVVDDGSDEPARLAARDAVHRHGAKYVQLDANRGPAFARNRGAAMAHQPYLIFLDADDSLEPGFGETVGAYLRANPDVTALHPALHYEGLPDDLATEFDPLRRRNSDMVTASGLVVKRAVFQAMGGFPEDPIFLERAGGEDVAFVNALSAVGEYVYWGRKLVRARAGRHLIDYLRRTRVEDGRVVFTERTPEEESGALGRAMTAYVTKVKERMAAG